MEMRGCQCSEVRVDDETRRISGYIALFGSDSVNMWGVIETINENAFDKTLRESKSIKALKNHNSDFILGNTASGTLSLRTDKKGLFADIDAPDTQWANDLRVSIKRGDVPGSSFGFHPIAEKRTQKEDEPERRELMEVELFEVSPGVVFPAYPEAELITARAMQELEKRGINWERIAGIIGGNGVRGFSDLDREVIEGAITALRDLLPSEPSEAPSQEAHAMEDPLGELRLLQVRARIGCMKGANNA